MNRKGFRLPQAAARLLAGVFSVWAVSATAAAPAGDAAPARPEKVTETAKNETATPPPGQPPEQQATPQTEQQSAADEKTSVVYSLRDYQRAEPTATSPEEYLSEYSNVDGVGQDGIARSLEGPDVVITAGTERTVYEYRQGGQLRLVKIIPRIGRPYYLVPADPTRGFGDLDQANRLLPQWKIIEF